MDDLGIERLPADQKPQRLKEVEHVFHAVQVSVGLERDGCRSALRSVFLALKALIKFEEQVYTC